MKALFRLKIYDNRVKAMMKICRISFMQVQLPFLTKFVSKQKRKLSLGHGIETCSLSSLFWVKTGNQFIKPRYSYDYEKEETVAVYNIDENVIYAVKDFDAIYRIVLRDGKIQRFI